MGAFRRLPVVFAVPASPVESLDSVQNSAIRDALQCILYRFHTAGKSASLFYRAFPGWQGRAKFGPATHFGGLHT